MASGSSGVAHPGAEAPRGTEDCRPGEESPTERTGEARADDRLRAGPRRRGAPAGPGPAAGGSGRPASGRGAGRDGVGSRGRSRPGVSAGSRPLRTDVEAWPRRALSALTIGALVLDAIDLAVRQGTDEQDGVRCASGILATGQKGLWHLVLGSRESADAWLSFLHDRTARGLKAPWLVSADGQPGLRQALPARSQAGGREVVPPRGPSARPGPHEAPPPGPAAADRAGLAEAAHPAGRSGRDGCAGAGPGPCPDRPLAGPRSRRDGGSGAGSGSLPGLSAVSQGASHEPSDHASARTHVRSRAAPDDGDAAVSDLPAGRQAETACLTLVLATWLTAAPRWRGWRMTPRLRRERDALRRERDPVQRQVA